MRSPLMLAVCVSFVPCDGILAQERLASAVKAGLDASDATWSGAVAIADGAIRGAARFDGDRARIDLGACPVSSSEPFTLRCSIRTTTAGFCTPLMARDGEAVGLSLVLGRSPGTISFEAWSWQSVRLGSLVRIDDGKWHTIEVPYDPSGNTAALFVDGVLQGVAELGEGASPNAVLRLGDNIGAHQPFAGDLDEVAVLRTTERLTEFASLWPVHTLVARHEMLRRLRDKVLPKATPSLAEGAAAAWPARRLAVRAHVADALGLVPPPPNVPLDVQVHGELVRDGVRLQRVSWIGFPGQRATGWLWLPEPMPKGRLPTILNPHGHWQNGARHPVVQARCAAFAKFGWIALATDSVHVEHVASGVNAVGAMTWHNQRAIDLLLARPDVDETKLGCTGASGGAQQTYYLMALEERIAAVAPMVMACYLHEIITDIDSHCGCNHTPRLAARTDVPEMCAVFAPKPVMFGSVGGDWTHNFPEQGLPELRAHWARLHGPEPRSRFAPNEGHNYDRPMREEVYGFLHDALLGPAADGKPRARVAEPEFRTWTLAELQPLMKACANVALDPETMAKEYLARRPKVDSLAALAPGLDLRVTSLLVEDGPDARAARAVQDGVAGWQPGVVVGEDGVNGVGIPYRRLVAADKPDPKLPWTVVIDPRGSAALLAARPEWLASVPNPVLVDPRPYGEWARFRPSWQRNGIFLGRGEGYQAALDVALVCNELATLWDKGAHVHVVGLGEAGVVALLAAHLTPKITRIVTDDLGETYAANGNRLPLCPEILRFRDVPELIATLPKTCDYALGGAMRDGATSPDGKLAPPFSAAELGRRVLEKRR